VTPEEGATAQTTSTAAAGEGSLTVYSGRNEQLVAPIIEQFEQQSGIQVDVRYGNTTELASTILEEGNNSPADVFFAQDAGALGAVAAEGLLAQMPDDVLNQVDERFRSTQGEWIGVSGRARVVAYNTQAVTQTELPETIFGFTDEQWRGRIGWAPTNASFQSFVTALRVLEGEDRAREWLEGIQTNDPNAYDNNAAVLQAVNNGEIDVGFVNHYYLFAARAEQGDDLPVENFYLTNGDPGALVNVAGAGILNTSDNQELAQQFVEFLLSEQAQQYFADETYEYPLIDGVAPNEALPPLNTIQTPDLDLSQLEDLEGTVQLLQDVGVLE
jgi:iron(III) transport system substrate-binding protein